MKVKMQRSIILFVFLLCLPFIQGFQVKKPMENVYYWVNGGTGDDNSVCGAEDSPCRTLNYTLYIVYQQTNITRAEITLQSNMQDEVTDLSSSNAIDVV